MRQLQLQLPNQKQWAAGLGGLLSFAIDYGFFLAGHPLPVPVDAALLTALPPIIAALVPPADVDVLRHVNDTIAQAGTILGKLTPASDSAQPVTTNAQALAVKLMH